VTDTDIIDFLDKWHTLHYKIEALYVVDGYIVTLTHDDIEIMTTEAETLRGAYLSLMKMDMPQHPSER